MDKVSSERSGFFEIKVIRLGDVVFVSCLGFLRVFVVFCRLLVVLTLFVGLFLSRIGLKKFKRVGD